MQCANQDATNIPVIDISDTNPETGEHLIDALVKWGFVFIKAHGSGFTEQIIDDMFKLVCAHISRFI